MIIKHTQIIIREQQIRAMIKFHLATTRITEVLKRQFQVLARM